MYLAGQNVVNPQYFIPKRHPNLNADQASDLFRKFPAKSVPKQIKGKIYWGSFGPVVSKKTVKNGSLMKNISPPQSLGDFSPSFISKGLLILGVLSLILIGIHYNK